MAAPTTSLGNVTVRKLNSVISSFWTKIKNTFAPKDDGQQTHDTTKFYRADGSWAVPTGDSCKIVYIESSFNIATQEFTCNDASYDDITGYLQSGKAPVVRVSVYSNSSATTPVRIHELYYHGYDSQVESPNTGKYKFGSTDGYENGSRAYVTSVKCNDSTGWSDYQDYAVPSLTKMNTDLAGKVNTTGDASNTKSTFTKANSDTSSMTSGGKLSEIFTAISSFFASLKALAFKDKVSDGDIDGIISASHIPDAIKDKIVFIDGTIARSGIDVYNVTCSTTYAQVSQYLSEGKVPVCKFSRSDTGQTWYFYYHMTYANNRHAFGSTDIYNVSNNDTAYASCVYVGTDDSWTFIEVETYDNDYWSARLATKASQTPTFSEASTRENLNGSNESMTTILGKIKKWFTDLGGGSSNANKVWKTDSNGTPAWRDDANTTYSNATQSAAGLMSASDKTKLDGVATNANNYTHPTTSGNKHIPSGGSSGQILRWSADGTAAWGADNDTKVTSAANHYAPSRDTSADKSASASGATAAWSIDVVKGVTLQTDGKGHVTGVAVTSGKIPAKPSYVASDVGAAPSSGSNYYVTNSNSSDVGSVDNYSVNTLAANGSTVAMVNNATDNPCGAKKWIHVLSLAWGKGTSSSWVSQMAMGTEAGDGMWYRTTSGNVSGLAWKRVMDSSNCSVSKSGNTLSVKINGVTQSLENTNTWRGIQNNLTSDSTTDSLSAAQGKALANGSARDSTKSPTTHTHSVKINGSTKTVAASGGTAVDLGYMLEILQTSAGSSAAYNLNTMTSSGVYFMNIKSSSSTGAPGNGRYTIIVLNAGGYVTQLAFGYYFRIRVNTGSEWKSWVTIATPGEA